MKWHANDIPVLKNVRIQTIIFLLSVFVIMSHFDSVLWENNNVRHDEVTAVLFLREHKILAQSLGYFF